MRSKERELATELEKLALAINATLARVRTAASEPGHALRDDAATLATLKDTGSDLSATLLALAERLEVAACEAVVFPNARCGIESVVRPSAKGYAVVLRDTDADRTLPTLHHFASRDEAIARAKHLVGVR